MAYECGVILAGGKSSRMGCDKALLPLGNAPTITDYVYRKLKPRFSNLFISAKNDKFSGRFPIVYDSEPSFSPLGAIATILETLPYERIFIVSVDTPLIDVTIIDALYDADTLSCDATVASAKNVLQPLCGIYHPSILPLAHRRMARKQFALHALLDQANTRVVNFDRSYWRYFFNANHPEEYAALQRLL